MGTSALLVRTSTITDSVDMALEQKPVSGIGQRRSAAKVANSAPYEDRRAAIIQAAAELFKEKGLLGTSLIDIARRLDTDRATLYYYFSSREDIFDAVVTDVVKRNLVEAESIRDSSGTAPEKLQTLIVDLMISFSEHYPFLFVYLQENMAHVPEKRKAWATEMRATNRRYEQTIEDIVQQGIAEGTLRDVGDSRVITYGIMGMVNWTNRWFNPDRTEQSAEEIGQTFAAMLLGGVVADR